MFRQLSSFRNRAVEAQTVKRGNTSNGSTGTSTPIRACSETTPVSSFFCLPLLLPGRLRQYDRAGLWTLLTFFFGDANLCTYFQPVESMVEHTVTVEINLAAVRCFDKAIAGLALDTADMADHGFMYFDGTALLPYIVFELTARRIEGLTDCLR